MQSSSRCEDLYDIVLKQIDFSGGHSQVRSFQSSAMQLSRNNCYHFYFRLVDAHHMDCIQFEGLQHFFPFYYYFCI